MPTVLNVGLDPALVGRGDPARQTFPAVDAAQVQAGLDAAAAELSDLGLGLDLCLFEDLDTAEEQFRTTVAGTHYEIIVIGGGVRLEPSLTPLFERIVNAARTATPDSVLCFNTGPGTIVETVRRWWPAEPSC